VDGRACGHEAQFIGESGHAALKYNGSGNVSAEWMWIFPKKVDTVKRKVPPSVFHTQKGLDTPV